MIMKTNKTIRLETQEYLCRYMYRGKEWGISIQAYSEQDAKNRCRQLNLTYDGKLMVRVPKED